MWAAQRRYLGRSAVQQPDGRAPARSGWVSADSVTDAATAFRDGEEAARINAAYRLGELAVNSGGGDGDAVAVLASGLEDAREGVRRAAQYGLAAAGHATAVPPLLALLRQPASATAAAYALGEACSRAADHAAAVAALRAAISRSEAAAEARLELLSSDERAELAAAVMHGGRGYDGKVYSLLAPMDLEVTRLRRTICAAAAALGLVGSRAVLADDQPTVAAAATELIRLAERPGGDPSAVFRSNLPPKAVEDNAAVALLRIVSAGRGEQLAPAREVQWDNPATRGTGALGGADRLRRQALDSALDVRRSGAHDEA